MTNAHEFDRIAQGIFFPIYAVIADDILKYTGKNAGRLLDLGCGGGHLGLSLLNAAPDLTGILMDLSTDAVNIANHRIREWGLDQRAAAVLGRAEEIPLPDGSIDLIVSRGSIHFWDDVEAAFREMLRVLTPGGMAYVGSGMGNREINKVIEEKMKAANPDWPGCVHRNSKGHTVEDYRTILTKHGVWFDIQVSQEKGKWTIFRKN